MYLLWAADSALPGMSSARVTGSVVLGLGFAASAAAVVPGFDQLLHGSKAYLAVTSLTGLAAVAVGLHMLITANGTSLAVVMAAMAVLWLIATIHHSLLARTGTIPPQPVRHGPRSPGPQRPDAEVAAAQGSTGSVLRHASPSGCRGSGTGSGRFLSSGRKSLDHSG